VKFEGRKAGEAIFVHSQTHGQMGDLQKLPEE
jgi:hypothetical protein